MNGVQIKCTQCGEITEIPVEDWKELKHKGVVTSSKGRYDFWVCSKHRKSGKAAKSGPKASKATAPKKSKQEMRIVAAPSNGQQEDDGVTHWGWHAVLIVNGCASEVKYFDTKEQAVAEDFGDPTIKRSVSKVKPIEKPKRDYDTQAKTRKSYISPEDAEELGLTGKPVGHRFETDRIDFVSNWYRIARVQKNGRIVVMMDNPKPDKPIVVSGNSSGAENPLDIVGNKKCPKCGAYMKLMEVLPNGSDQGDDSTWEHIWVCQKCKVERKATKKETQEALAEIDRLIKLGHKPSPPKATRRSFEHAPLKADWCKCKNPTKAGDTLRMEDNACSCGMEKHHYHCRNCGGVAQVG